MKIVKKDVTRTRKEASARLYIILASLLDEPNRMMRGKLILEGFDLVKEME